MKENECTGSFIILALVMYSLITHASHYILLIYVPSLILISDRCSFP